MNPPARVRTTKISKIFHQQQQYCILLVNQSKQQTRNLTRFILLAFDVNQQRSRSFLAARPAY